MDRRKVLAQIRYNTSPVPRWLEGITPEQVRFELKSRSGDYSRAGARLL